MTILDIYTHNSLAQAQALPFLSCTPWWLQSTPWLLAGTAFATGVIVTLLVL